MSQHEGKTRKCVDCRYHRETFGAVWFMTIHKCHHPMFTDPVTGEIGQLCGEVRCDTTFGGSCGSGGKLWEPKADWLDASYSLKRGSEQ